MSTYMGIDWSQDKHDVAFMNAAGAIIARLTIPHQPAGFHELETTRQQLGVTAAECLVGLETAHNLLLDYLWDQGYQQIYVIPPLVVKSSRGRYGHSVARDDTLDAQLVVQHKNLKILAMIRQATDIYQFEYYREDVSDGRPDNSFLTSTRAGLDSIRSKKLVGFLEHNRLAVVVAEYALFNVRLTDRCCLSFVVTICYN